MRYLLFILSVFVTVGLIFILNSTIMFPIPFGKLFSPQHGFWQNAEDVNQHFDVELKFPQLKGKATVYFDERLVPHVFAKNEADIYFIQGYLHAKFRLWQMETQSHAAAGRLSEIIGNAGLKHDREFRRLGMVYAAENSLQEMEKDSATKISCDAYTAGVNAYIENLKESELPIEYKLLGYAPEKWTNLKTALFLKYMSYELSGHDDDFEMSNAKSFFSPSDFAKLYPLVQDSLDPIVPKGTIYNQPTVSLKVPAHADSVYFNNKELLNIESEKPDKVNGSNNWAVSGKKTLTGSPILCNDPHLDLSLPSLWYEMQLSSPTLNVYGVTFPGAPNVIIGFNDSCSFGFTNGERDVKDYYEIKFKDDSKKEYWFDSSWKKTSLRVERIKIKNNPDFMDTVAYTNFGPVMYDKSFSGGKTNGDKYYAVRWKAHDKSNELKTFNLLDHAKNYADYSTAIDNLQTPGQNVVFACKNGDIAIRTQGEWPAKWNGQGDFIMPGTDSSYMWQAMIPSNETPSQFNPERGFVSSANQKPADTTYPYYLGRNYPLYRGIIVNRKLNAMNNISIQDMMKMQTDNYNVFAEYAMPIFLKNIRTGELTDLERKYFSVLQSWNLTDDIHSKGATIFDILWNNFYAVVYDDEFEKAPKPIMKPFPSTLLEAVLKDSAYSFLDNIKTPAKETLADDATVAFKKTVIELKRLDIENKMEWVKYKSTSINHLARIPAFSCADISIGGGVNCINATKNNHGPSWRMIVSLTKQTEAWGVYPGGEDGNPGSKYYDDFVNRWAEGKYYPLWMMNESEGNDRRIVGSMKLMKE